MNRVIFAIAILTIQGCVSLPHYQAYEGPQLSDAKQARLSAPHIPHESCDAPDYKLLFTLVDGKSTDNYFGGYDNGCRYPSELLLKPGKHQIGVFYTPGMSSPQYSSFCFLAKAGENYKAVRKVEGYSTTFQAIRLSSNLEETEAEVVPTC